MSCEKADLRPSPDGVLIYDDDGVREVIAPPSRVYPNKDGVIDELYDAVVSGNPPLHDGQWGHRHHGRIHRTARQRPANGGVITLTTEERPHAALR